jgi:Family of unknown function (DUF5304)
MPDANNRNEPSDTGPEGTTAAKTAEALVAALREAGPEATEHLLNAARELLAAAKAVIEASERIVTERQSDTPKVERIDLE